MLNDTTYVDISLLIDPALSGEVQAIRCHSVILAARSAYFARYIHLSKAQSDNNNESVVLDLRGLPFITAFTMTSLLEYLYLDKVNTQLGNRKKTDMVDMASHFCLNSLSAALLSSHGEGSEVPMSLSYDMEHAFMNARDCYADIKFIYTTSSSTDTTIDNNDSDDVDMSPIYAHKAILIQIGYFEGMFHSHFKESSDVSKLEGESSHVTTVDLTGLITDGVSIEAFRMLLMYAYTGIDPITRTTHPVTAAITLNTSTSNKQGPATTSVSTTATTSYDRQGLADESDDKDTTTATIATATADTDIDTIVDTLTELLIATNRLGYIRLYNICEKRLIDLIRKFPGLAQALLGYAQSYGFLKIERLCLDALRFYTRDGGSDNTTSTNIITNTNDYSI